MAVKMSWEYVAGFFDGEGCVHMSHGGRCKTYVSLTQTQDRGMRLLREIQRFLIDEDMIHSHIGSFEKKNRTKTMHVLKITKRSDVECFLLWVLPHVRIKKVETQDVLRYFKMFPQIELWDGARYHTPKGLRARIAA